jgi:hypothetical protein
MWNELRDRYLQTEEQRAQYEQAGRILDAKLEAYWAVLASCRGNLPDETVQRIADQMWEAFEAADGDYLALGRAIFAQAQS